MATGWLDCSTHHGVGVDRRDVGDQLVLVVRQRRSSRSPDPVAQTKTTAVLAFLAAATAADRGLACCCAGVTQARRICTEAAGNIRGFAVTDSRCAGRRSARPGSVRWPGRRWWPLVPSPSRWGARCRAPRRGAEEAAADDVHAVAVDVQTAGAPQSLDVQPITTSRGHGQGSGPGIAGADWQRAVGAGGRSSAAHRPAWCGCCCWCAAARPSRRATGPMRAPGCR